MKIAVTGKGGVGKTTLAGGLARLLADEGYRVLAVDADPDANLASSLGIPAERMAGVVPIADMKELIAERTDSKPGSFGSFFKINPRVDDLPDELSVEHSGVRLLVLGTVKKGGGGCICPESVLLKALVSHMLFARDEALILDMEAGVEHLGRGTTASMDAMLVVIEPGLRSVQTAMSIRRLAADLGVTRLLVVLNKLVDPEERALIEEPGRASPAGEHLLRPRTAPRRPARRKPLRLGPPLRGGGPRHPPTAGARAGEEGEPLMPFPVLLSERLSQTVGALRIAAPDVARNARAGQFVILRIDETGERIPLTLADWSAEEGWVWLVFQEVGKSTCQLGRLREGDALADLTGPLGIPSEIGDFGTALCVGGGVGIAAIHPICRALREAGNRVVSILGARTAELVIMIEQMKAVSDEVVITTDDGSLGHKGVVTWAMEEELKKGGIGMVLAIGPAVMMKFASAVTRPYGVPTRVSLNSIMLDGTGMCGTCRCEVEGKTRFACVDGPEFDGHQVDWGLLLTRLSVYREEEQASLERFLSTPP